MKVIYHLNFRGSPEHLDALDKNELVQINGWGRQYFSNYNQYWLLSKWTDNTILLKNIFDYCKKFYPSIKMSFYNCETHKERNMDDIFDI